MSKWALSALRFPEGLERTLRRFPWLAPAAGRGEVRAGSDQASLWGHMCQLARFVCGEGGMLSAPHLPSPVRAPGDSGSTRDLQPLIPAG